jgi:putative transposase
MAHSYCVCMMHIVFSTKGRLPSITQDIESRLHAYMGGIARENKIVPIEIGGVEDHVHLFLGIPSTMAVAKAVQLIKGGSSKWIHDTFPDRHGFEWQEGYGAFSVNMSAKQNTIDYIKGQRAHHSRVSFQEEYRAFLAAHGIEFDEKYVWG